MTTEDLAIIRATTIVTGRYQTWRPEDGAPVRITVGAPRFWGTRRPLVDGRLLAPFGLLSPSLPLDECRRRYEQRLDARADRIVSLLARIADEHPGERLVLCCFEDVEAGEECHRRWFAEWMQDRHGIAVPEVETTPLPSSALLVDQPKLPF
jgi:hypothetical protein